MNFTAYQSDTDCDGTTFSAKRIVADSLEAAQVQSEFEVVPECHFLLSEVFHNLSKWEQNYYRKEGYCSLGARWNPWVYDDTIGIPALDHTNDPPIYSDEDIEMFQMGS